MADVSQIPPAPPTTAAKPLAQSAQPATVQSSPQLQNQAATPVGTTLSGYIVNRDASGNPVLRTATGDVAFTTDQFLKIGSDVTVQLSNNPGNSAGPAQGEVLTIDGQPAEETQAQAAPASPSVILGGAIEDTQTATSSAPAAAPTVTVSGTLLSPPSDATETSLPAGSQLTLNVTSLTAPPATAAAQSSAAAEPTANSATPVQYATYARAAGTAPTAGSTLPAATGSTPPTVTAEPASAVVATTAAAPAASTIATPASPSAAGVPATEATTTPETAVATPATAATNPAGSTTAAVIPTATDSAEPAVTAPALPAQAASPVATTTAADNPVAATAPQPGQTIAATVINTPLSGETVLQTPIGLIQLQQGVSLPVGSTLTFALASVLPPPAQSAAGEPTPLSELALHWPNLQQLLTALSNKSEESGTPPPAVSMMPVLAAALDAAGASVANEQSLSSGLMLFISALSGGDFRGWLGKDNARWLEDNDHGDLIKKAEGDFQSLGRLFAEPEPHQWQPLFFPLMAGGELQQVRLFVKRDRKQGNSRENSQEDGDTRFVVEIDLSQLGEMQMDGFIRRQENNGERNVQFDLVIRSLSAISPDAQRDILQIYTATGELTGYNGGLSFQSVREFPVNPMQDILAHTPDVLA